MGNTPCDSHMPMSHVLVMGSFYSSLQVLAYLIGGADALLACSVGSLITANVIDIIEKRLPKRNPVVPMTLTATPIQNMSFGEVMSKRKKPEA